MKDDQSLIPAPNLEIILDSGVDSLLSMIRPHWQAKNLISRVKRLLPTDPRSACQRIFNASIHDLKEKLCLAGVDIVAEAAKLNKLPPISRSEDIEQYSPYNTIELAYRVVCYLAPKHEDFFEFTRYVVTLNMRMMNMRRLLRIVSTSSRRA